eukprot:2620572-Rhodomonas_salina.1
MPQLITSRVAGHTMLSERAFRVSQPAGAAARGVPPRDGHQFKCALSTHHHHQQQHCLAAADDKADA